MRWGETASINFSEWAGSVWTVASAKFENAVPKHGVGSAVQQIGEGETGWPNKVVSRIGCFIRVLVDDLRDASSCCLRILLGC